MHRPAAGEGAAIAGYHYQYIASATLVLARLMDGSLEWIRIKDVEAGRVDDFVMGHDNRVAGYQFKHRASGGFSFRDLTQEESPRQRDKVRGAVGTLEDSSSAQRNRPPLIRQLADGWHLLRESYGSGVTVHLATNVPSSRHDRIEIAAGSSGSRHLTAFLQEAWIPVQESSHRQQVSIPDKWKPAWELMRNASGLDQERFPDFVRSCRLEFMVEPSTLLAQDASRDDAQTYADIDRIRHILFDLAARETAPVHLDRKALLERLGWTDRFRFRNIHVFPVDEALYHPIAANVGELEERLGEITQGYIGVFGSPGSGKSTLLTQVLRYRPERIVRYYAFVPEAFSPNFGRGEPENFLHDLVLALHQKGYLAGDATVGFDRMALIERLHAQIGLLGEDWVANGNKTIILIDGLDHISRGTPPSRSFLEDLPHPATIPDGVVFLVGSQSDIVLPNHIRITVREERRRVEMEPLSQGEILAVTQRSGLLARLDQGNRARLVDLSAGHPLALVYLLNALKQASADDEVGAILNETPAFTGDIATRYESAWSEVASEHRVVEALGYAARMRGPVALDWLENWLGFEPLRLVRQYFGHFFRREHGDRAYFFHDSFRAFLAERTSETWPGQPDPPRNAALHRDLAERYSREPLSSPLASEEIYHRIEAGQDDHVVELATQEYFRNQVFALRPIDAIREDVNLALQAAGRTRNIVSFSRLVLAGAELEQRLWHLDQIPLVSLLIELGESHLAVEHLRIGSRLRIAPDRALNVVPDLIDAGMPTEAARLFDLAEPLDLLSSGRPIDDQPHGDTKPLLIAWAEAATRYHPVDRIVGIARELTVAPVRWHQDTPEKKTRSLQNEVIFHAAMSLIREKRWDDVSAIASSLDPARGSDTEWWVWIHVHAWNAAKANDQERARSFFDVVVGQFGPSDLEPEVRVANSTAALRLMNDEALARLWIKDVPPPDIDILAYGGDGGFRPFAPLFAHTRIQYALGGSADYLDPSPAEPNTTKTGLARFQRLVQVVARIEGASWRGDHLSPDVITAAVQPYLYLLDRRLSYQTMDTSWFGAERARAGLIERLIHATAQHGDAASNAIRLQLERSWNDFPWRSDDRRSAIVGLYQANAPLTWAIAALRDLEATLFQGELTFERIEECRYQAEAWMDLGQDDLARSMLHRLILESNAIAFRKDHQLTTWIDQWLPEAMVVKSLRQ